MPPSPRDQILALWKQDTTIFAACLRVQPKGETDFVDFKPFKTQEQVWDLIFGHLRVQFLKPRQVGVSYAVLIEVLRRTICIPHHRTVLLAQHGSTAVEMGQHIVDLYESIPEIYSLAPPAQGKKLTPRTLSFANGSRISIGTANSPFWRGGKAHFALMTEAAYYDDLKGVLARIMPMLGPSSPCLIESTANGDGAYKDLWDDPHSAFHHRFISWVDHPTYVDSRPLPALLPEEEIYIRLHKLPTPRASWYVHTKRLQPGGSQALFDQEFPINENVAFISSGDRFLPHLLPCPKLPTTYQAARIFLPFYGHDSPRAHAYCAGIDVASGSAKGDFSTIVILDVTERKVAATYQAREAPHSFVRSAIDLLKAYGNPRTCVEVNFDGGHVQHELRAAHIPMYVRVDEKGLYTDREEQHGFQTNANTRPNLLYAIYAAAVGDMPWVLSDPRLIQELNQLIYVRHDYPAAPSGKHDDLAFALGLALQAVPQATVERAPPKPKLPAMPKTPPRSYEELDKRIRMYGQKAVPR